MSSHSTETPFALEEQKVSSTSSSTQSSFLRGSLCHLTGVPDSTLGFGFRKAKEPSLILHMEDCQSRVYRIKDPISSSDRFFMPADLISVIPGGNR